MAGVFIWLLNEANVGWYFILHNSAVCICDEEYFCLPIFKQKLNAIIFFSG